MTYGTITDFLNDWKSESAKTQKVLGRLTDEVFTKEIFPGVRTIETLAKHMVSSIAEMINRTGLSVYNPDHDLETARASAVDEIYKTVSASLVSEISSKWKDEDLKKEDDMYGEMWTRRETLSSLIKHEIHHRAQLITLMRAAGLNPPGVYGPSKEEWSAYGMEPQK